MDAQRLSLVKRLFLRVVDLRGDERVRELDAACADPDVRREVQRLLEHAIDRDEDTLDRMLASGPSSADGARPPSSEFASAHGRFVPGAVLGARYRIVGLLGAGGMGEVYRADDLELGQAVALKFLPESLASQPEARDRFRREVRLAREIAHPNVCRVHDICDEEGHVFLSMEFVDGDDLSKVLRRMGRPSPEKALDITHQLCLGLAAAHERGVLHRDLKPANVLIDGRGRVRITDFGLAGLADELATASERVGTPAYMAPEQLAKGRATVRSDLFSLGLVLHELFTGRRAFPGESIDEILRARASGPVSSTTSLEADVDPAVDRVIGACVELDPMDRPSSVHAVLTALPGGDPLAAALATGETPSPDLVASAGARGGLRPLTALALLLAVVGLTALLVQVNRREVRFPARSGQVLAILAEEHLARLGLADLPDHDALGFEPNSLVAAQGPGPTSASGGELGVDGPGHLPAYRFWRRWSERPLESEFPHGPGLILLDHPPRGLPGDVWVVLDSDTGHLLELAAVPREGRLPGAAARGPVDVPALFTAAGIDPDRARPTDETLSVPAYCDTARTWRLESSRRPGSRATLGTHAGQLAWFRIDGVSESEPFVEWMPPWAGFFLLVLQLAAVVLALRNARAGRGDRRNALRFALLMGLAYVVMESSAALARGTSLVDLLAELLWLRGAGHVLLHAFQVWVFYLAVEPYLRRARPQAMVGWIRWISGRGADPAVGREVALGALAGVLSACATAVVRWTGPAHGTSDGVTLFDQRAAMTLAGTEMLLQQVIVSFTAPLMFTVQVSFFWLLLMLAFRRRALLACLLLCGLYLVLSVTLGRPLPEGLAETGFAVLWTLLFFRVGLLSTLAMLIVVWALSIPIGGDLDAWHAAWTAVPLAIVLGLAGFGCWAAAGGHAALRGLSGAIPRG